VHTDGKCDRRIAGEANGYCPRRRSIMHVIGTNLIKHKSPIYKAIYDERKAFYMLRPDLKPIMAHKMAMRIMEQELLTDLWCVWNGKENHKRVSKDAEAT